MTISEGPAKAAGPTKAEAPAADKPEAPEARREARAWCWSVVDSPIGPLLLAATDQGLAQVVFHADEVRAAEAVARLTARLGAAPEPAPASLGPAADAPFGSPGTSPADSPADSPVGSGGTPPCLTHLGSAVRQLERYFTGALREFTVPLDWSLITGFNRRVLRELAEHVPYGTVVGYGDLADRVGDPGAARAVGVAMGSNPLPVVVPCHRVVESGGGIGGFGGGLETKRTLLALEGILPQPLF
ncbi:methylated-DNA--[protein]-cysteine S-methyltransferase [Streptomyces sparsogenes]|uniref:methylated-DNA--[protein]-cysteine S-methyltransferase n=1 Tax=Streptomyces sparsogenes TaxID=67365 RepID=UPI00384AA689